MGGGGQGYSETTEIQITRPAAAVPQNVTLAEEPEVSPHKKKTKKTVPRSAPSLPIQCVECGYDIKDGQKTYHHMHNCHHSCYLAKRSLKNAARTKAPNLLPKLDRLKAKNPDKYSSLIMSMHQQGNANDRRSAVQVYDALDLAEELVKSNVRGRKTAHILLNKAEYVAWKKTHAGHGAADRFETMEEGHLRPRGSF